MFFHGEGEKEREREILYQKRNTGWWFQIFFMFTPIWGRFPFWRSYVSNGLVQPPTRTETRRSFIKDLSSFILNPKSFKKKHQLSTVVFPLETMETTCFFRRRTYFWGKTNSGIWSLKSFGIGLFPVMDSLWNIVYYNYKGCFAPWFRDIFMYVFFV